MNIDERLADQAKARSELAARLRADFLDDEVPADIADHLFAFAWEEGHASGVSEVTFIYDDLSDLVNKAYHAGRAAHD